MKKFPLYLFGLLPLILPIFLIQSFTGGSSEVVLKHHNFTAYYNASLKESDSVSYDLTAAMVSCSVIDRKDAFKTDPDLPKSASPNDYAVNTLDKTKPLYNPDRASWIDEGHLMSYQSAMCTPFGVFECFYMTNMLPQFHAFNAGDWKTLEVQERVWAKTQTLHIIAGVYGVYTGYKLFPAGHLPAGEVIPKYMWKAILMNGKYSVWIMPNDEKSVGDKGLKVNKYNAWLSSIHKFDLASIGAEIKREGI